MASKSFFKEDLNRKDYLPWTEKYRPQNFEEFSSQTDILATIGKFIDNKSLPHMLFYGSPGTGKTSAILAIAKKLYGKANKLGMVLELNASDERGLNSVRERILVFAQSRGLFSQTHKLIILDEADSMTQDAQNSLRRIIEKYTMNVRFCIICNYQTKIIPAIQSRCMKFRFAPLPQDQMLERLQFILKSEGAEPNKDGIEAAVSLGMGDMRKTINILESSFLSFKKVDSHSVYSCCGQPTKDNIKELLDILLNKKVSESFCGVMKMKTEYGLALNDIITHICEELHAHNFESKKITGLIRKLAEIEYRLDQGSNEKAQVAGVVSAFQQFRTIKSQ